VVDDSRALSEAGIEQGRTVLTRGSNTHLLLVDVAKSYGLTGRQAESALRDCGITLNRNSLPADPNGPWYTSGLRLGTPATTTLGMGTAEMTQIAKLVHQVLSQTKATRTSSGEESKAKYAIAEGVQTEVHAGVQSLLSTFPLYPELGEL